MRRLSQATSPGPRLERGGIAAVEFAVIAPLLVLLVAGTFEMARAVLVRDVLSDSVRQACRMAIQPGSTTQQISSEISSTLKANSLNAADATVTTLVNNTSADVSTALPEDKITVRVSIPYASVSWLPAQFLSGSLQAEMSMMRQ